MAASSAQTCLDETDDGSFKRTASVHRDAITQASSKYPAVAGRYHLYISHACPWANRCLAVLKLKGLEDAIGVSIVHPTWEKTKPEVDEHAGWVFKSPEDPPIPSTAGHGSFKPKVLVPDSVNNAPTVRALYDIANDTGGKYSVPVLWDKHTSTIVNNESSEIIRMFNSAFNENGLCKNPELDLYPKHLRSEIDAVNEWVYPTINNGVYRCGFATTQDAYETAFAELFGSLDRVEDILSRQRYIAGDQLTEADIRLFMTLVRFDEVYVVYFKTNGKAIREYPNIMDYCRELYQIPQIGESIDMEHIKMHYFTSHPILNTYAIIPVGSNTIENLQQPHNRGRFNGVELPAQQTA
uniref:GST C-terminal domain-containing protein n=2 Tax=Phaeomonas parva TaxID=124430 RepID=A0A7S1UL66_9STRA|mmetsp:Transcript_7502/g.21817  ORF Transcript_7502/g.21817 Transcript_7502/m.21817 type:complete len:353 (+) Transcript_7502:437-1495(+)